MKDIPFIILNRDRLETTERLVGQLKVLGYDNIFILDAESTYPPLLQYYDTCKDFTLIHHHNRSGHKALWTDGILKDLFRQCSWVAVSDSDIELGQDTPKDFIQELILLAKDFRVYKVGLAIEYRDIENEYLKKIIQPIESRYWYNRLPHHTWPVYNAPVDTTMCIVRPDQPFIYDGIRVGGKMTCKHTDWYQDWSNLTEEQQYYMTHADERIATTKQHYLAWKTTQG